MSSSSCLQQKIKLNTQNSIFSKQTKEVESNSNVKPESRREEKLGGAPAKYIDGVN